MPKSKNSPSETDEISGMLGENQPETDQETEAEASKGSGEGETETEAKVTIGGVEYTAEEAARLVGKAKEVEGIEKEQNIDVTQLYPEFTKKSQLLKDPVQLGAYIAKEFGTEKVPTPESQLESQAVKEARDKYGIVFKDDLEAFKSSFRQELLADQLLEDARDIEKESGIKVPELLEYMKVAQLTDPYEAAEKMVKYQEITAGAKPTQPTFTEKSGSSGTHVPQGKKLPSVDDTEGMRNLIGDLLNNPGVDEES